MTTSANATHRRNRPARGPVRVPADFEALDLAHREALDMLEHLDVLVRRLAEEGVDREARHQARRILDYFEGPGRAHHEQEESEVFPVLLESGDEHIIQHVQRLCQDHGWIEEDWRELAPQIDAIACGYDWYDLAMLQAALPVLSQMWREHIALEERVVYPAARELLRRASRGG